MRHVSCLRTDFLKNLMKHKISILLIVAFCFTGRALPQQTDSQTVDKLLQRLADDEARIKSLEAMVATLSGHTGMQPATPGIAAPAPEAFVTPAPAAGPQTAPVSPVMPPMDAEEHEHMMEVPGGPTLKFRGFFDFSFDKGSVAQNLQYPLGAPAYSAFRTGEFDLFMSSQLSPRLSFLGEMVFSSGTNNNFGVDLERYQLTFKENRYFSVSGGRFHTAIGYYNTAYHHGTWFSTATGRPLMYYFEDSGGPLPVHEVGLTTTGALPGTGKLDMHWVAEIGNGQAPPGTNFGDGVQNFATNRNRKDLNFALYSRPEWLPGLQVGGSYLTGDLAATGLPRVDQTVSSVYAVYVNSNWEILNEAVLMHHQITDGGRAYNSPMGYTQIAYTFGGKWRPYFRWQEVNVPSNDPVSNFVGRYEGPSWGLRWDVFDYAALKLQYNRVYVRTGAPENGIESAVAFTF